MRKDEKKWASQGKKRGRAIEKSLEIGFVTGKSKKRWASQGKKRDCSLKKTPELGPKTGKSAKNGDFGAKKWALLLILPCYEVAKWAQMNFSRIFFR